MGQRVIGISGSLIWPETLMELIFSPYGDFRVQLVKSILLTSMLVPPGIFPDLLRSVQMLKREWGAERNGKLLLVKLQPCILSLQWKACLRQNCSLGSCACSKEPALGQNTLMMMMMMNIFTICPWWCPYVFNTFLFFLSKYIHTQPRLLVNSHLEERKTINTI